MNYDTYIQSAAWRRKREAALERADNHCQLCGSTDALDVHHNTYERLGSERPGDLIALCRACHDAHHARMRQRLPYLWFVTPEARAEIERMVLVKS